MTRLMIIMVLFSGACTDEGPDFIVTGIVRDEMKTTLTGVTVELNTASNVFPVSEGTTDDLGEFIFSFFDNDTSRESLSATITFAKSGYETVTRAVTLKADEIFFADEVLTEPNEE